MERDDQRLVISFFCIFAKMADKVYVGFWINKDTRKKIKVACAVHNINQGDVMDLLITKWINAPHIQEEIKELINGEK